MIWEGSISSFYLRWKIKCQRVKETSDQHLVDVVKKGDAMKRMIFSYSLQRLHLFLGRVYESQLLNWGLSPYSIANMMTASTYRQKKNPGVKNEFVRYFLHTFVP